MTIYTALADKLGRTPTNAELKADVERIKREAIEELARTGGLSHQRPRIGRARPSKRVQAGYEQIARGWQ